MNPCPCGYKTHPKIECQCLPNQILRYRQKLSGPLLDRIDLQIEVPPVDFEDLNRRDDEIETSSIIQKRVLKTRMIQQIRLEKFSKKLNAEMTPKLMNRFCNLDNEGSLLMKNIMEKFQLSARSYTRILKVARTIADMEEAINIQTPHLLEAVQYRSLDRQQ
jgi:magnesium chelatase family protein